MVQFRFKSVIDSIGFFKNRSPKFLQAILPMLKEKEIIKGEVLYSEGDGADYLFFMKEGEIMLYCDISEEVRIPIIETD